MIHCFLILFIFELMFLMILAIECKTCRT
jgi:hypothetical protein